MIAANADATAYVASYAWILRRSPAMADEFRAEVLENVSAEEWNAACDALQDYVDRKVDGFSPPFEEARVEIKPPTVTRMGDPRGGESTWTLMPAPPGVCSQCAVDHAPDAPHNQQSLYYQYTFYAEHHRWPTWTDAMAHCTQEVQNAWKESLASVGVNVEAPPG